MNQNKKKVKVGELPSHHKRDASSKFLSRFIFMYFFIEPSMKDKNFIKFEIKYLGKIFLIQKKNLLLYVCWDVSEHLLNMTIVIGTKNCVKM